MTSVFHRCCRAAFSAGLAASAALLAPSLSRAAALAFPGAEGFGAGTTGGRGGTIYHVTNLNDSGAGSFRDAVSQPSRVVVFDLGGYITLNSELSVSSNITIAGQTAPGDGVALYGQAVSFSGSSNIVVRYLRFREGITGGRGKSSIMMDTSTNVILDHCSIEWGRWDCFDMNSSNNVTVQYCMIGEGIDPQSFGLLCQSDNVTLSHNLFFCNNQRSPKAKGTIQYINNVVYNWGSCGFVGGHSAAPHFVDIINNTFVAGPSSNDRFVGQFTATDNVYQVGNVTDLDKNGALNPRAVVPADYTDPNGSPVFANAAQMAPAIPVTTHSAAAAFQIVVAEAGASQHRDSVDTRLVGYVTSLGTQGQILVDPATVGGRGTLASGTPPVDTDKDGMPDSWETARGLNPSDDADGALDRDGDGYSNFEEYLSWLAGDFPNPATTPTPVNGASNVSVSPTLNWTAGSGATAHNVFFGSTSSPTFKVSQAANTYVPGALASSTTYFWRIDEQDTATGATTKGTLWSFKTGAGGAVATVYQAEAAKMSTGSVLETINAGWTGSGYVNTNNAVGAFVEWTVTVPSAGVYTLNFRFANGTTVNRPADLRINGVLVQSAVPFAGTGAWTTWTEGVLTKTLNAGSNLVRLTATTSNGCANLDKLTVQ